MRLNGVYELRCNVFVVIYPKKITFYMSKYSRIINGVSV